MERTYKWTLALSMAIGLMGGCASGSDTKSGDGGGEAGGGSGGDGGAASTGGAMSTGGTTQPDTCVALDGVCGAGEDCGCSDCQGKNDAGQPIYNLAMRVFPINAQGLIYDELLDHHLSTLWGNATWSYETTSAEGQFSKYLQTVDFIAGAAFAPPKPDEAAGSAGSPQADAIVAMTQRLGVIRANREAHRGVR